MRKGELSSFYSSPIMTYVLHTLFKVSTVSQTKVEDNMLSVCNLLC